MVRIIGGHWRSRRLEFPDHAALRPTPDRVRETVFNWLAPQLPGARCLDLFAGSGALGLELLSRGAAQVTFVASSRRSIEAVKANLDALGFADRARVVTGDGVAFAASSGSFDLALLQLQEYP